mmetsp:Transcript_19497/g.45328  ORF Transcript_19497/g.45328 Transcript_19497/m.45328 type:complete len:227 (-) Transcript_19497:201-881(-)
MPAEAHHTPNCSSSGNQHDHAGQDVSRKRVGSRVHVVFIQACGAIHTWVVERCLNGQAACFHGCFTLGVGLHTGVHVLCVRRSITKVGCAAAQFISTLVAASHNVVGIRKTANLSRTLPHHRGEMACAVALASWKGRAIVDLRIPHLHSVCCIVRSRVIVKILASRTSWWWHLVALAVRHVWHVCEVAVCILEDGFVPRYCGNIMHAAIDVVSCHPFLKVASATAT